MMWLSSPRVRHAFAFLLSAAVLLLLAYSSAERAWAVDGERTYRVVAVEDDDVLNIRAGPSAGHPVIGEIPPSGRGLRLTGPCRSWCPISYNGASGWVHARYLAIEPAVAPFIERLPAPARPAEPAPLPRRLSQAYWRVTGVAVADGLRVHGEPSLDAPVVHVFEAQSGCIRLAGSCQKPWCQVRFPTGGGERIGWVNSKYLSPSGGPCGR
jgi:uncharacterized protein YraI